jgi:hypothetical protein
MASVSGTAGWNMHSTRSSGGMATTSEAMGFIGASGARRSALAADWRAPDRRRILQLALSTVWLLDAVLQFQPYMFTKAFGNQMIAGAADGNPAGLAHPITWAGHAIAHHAVASNSVFALVQLLIALGIAWRPTVKLALAGSVVWALAVWWIGEGLGGVLTAAASPLTGAPGAVILYGLLAVLLWPTDRPSTTASFVAARPLGATTARALWLVLWGSMAYDALAAANRGPQALHDMIRAMASGQPHWLASLDRSVATLVAHRGLAFSVALAVVCALVAVGPSLPPRPSRAAVVLAVVVALVIWVVGEGFGDIFSGSGTDPNTGPLLILLAAAYWPGAAAAKHARAPVAADVAPSLSLSGP